MRRLHRRRFLAATAAGLGAAATARLEGAGTPSKTVRVAVIGVHSRGKALAGAFAGARDTEVVAVCDVDASVIGAAVAETAKHQSARPRVERDWRRLLDDASIDALVVATPDHWHGPMTIAACLAGKDVYVEKPVSHNVEEGGLMVRAAREHGRVVQVGTQRRSQDMMREACEFVRSGKLGHVAMARAWITSTRPNLGHVPDSATPAGLDWDLWLGPAPMRPFNKSRFHYHWRWFWDTGTGEIGNNGVHYLDIARWGLGVDHPVRVSSGGGQFVHKDDRETPDTHIATFEFPSDKLLVWEHRIWSKRGIDDWGGGMEFYGEKGTVMLRDQSWKIVNSDGMDAEHSGGSGWRQHVENFLDCVRTRERPNADVETGHRSTTLCHLGNIAHLTHSTLAWDGASARIAENDSATQLLRRTYRAGYELPEV